MIDTIRSFLALGGPVVAIIGVLSVFALAMLIMKLGQFWRERVGRHGRANEALHAWLHRDYAGARQLLAGDRSALGATLAAAMRMMANGAPRQLVEQEAERIAASRLHGLERGFRALDAIAQVSPLLGLFGTVLGMIEAFRQLQDAGNAVDPAILAGGIWVALLTTAAGLAVAIPVSLSLTWLETTLDNERAEIESATATLLTQSDTVRAAAPAHGAGTAHAT
jgi:biopolymer transport protein ExbB